MTAPKQALYRPILGLLVAAALWLTPHSGAAQQGATPVGVDKVLLEPQAQTMPVVGRFVAPESGIVATRIAERVTEMTVRVGDRVRRGDVLAKLSADRMQSERTLRVADLRRAEAQITREKASLAKMQQTYARVISLRGSTAYRKDRQEDTERDMEVAGSALGQAEADLLRAQANLNLADIALKDTTIIAPYPAVVLVRHTVAGNYARVGDPIVTLLNDRDMEIEADVPAIRTGGLLPGTKVRVTLQDGGMLKAVVRVVVQEENTRTRTRSVRLSPELGERSGSLASNQSVTVQIPIGRANDVVTVHKDAIVVLKGRTMVYVVEDGKAAIRQVVTGNAIGARFEVKSGLKPGDIVVVRGNERLRPGQSVKPLAAG
ncbi:MAG: efflux RND transporter periplasmic adaptor subunit [Proteobacteria bacterium]|nr:efflux RND transporter periplasmic adaptor subunit [Pseudomonadota bacterium]MDA1309261.1 efflux RND transporter periplasmic adaptor subunit [Pseudomonadota bacterium]